MGALRSQQGVLATGLGGKASFLQGERAVQAELGHRENDCLCAETLLGRSEGPRASGVPGCAGPQVCSFARATRGDNTIGYSRALYNPPFF